MRAIGGNRAFHMHLDQFAVNPKRPRRGTWNVAQGQTRMPRKIGRLDGSTMFGEVLWTGANHLREVDDLAYNQSRIAERAHLQCDVDVVSDQVDQSVRDQEFACDARITRQKVGERGRKMIDSEGRERVNPQVSARRQTRRGDVGFGGFNGPKNVAGRSR
jgi:hypothetical protein